jgi:DNA-binding GntR family transcriptional regulator
VSTDDREGVGVMDAYSIEKSVPYYDQVYDSIKRKIILGDFRPGEKIFEAKIARQFQISRSPVREAVRALVKEGLLVIENSKITVYKPNSIDVEEIYQCRMALESLATKLTAKLASEEQLQEIEETLIKTEKLLKNEDVNSYEEITYLNSQFHDLIIQYCKNKRLQKQLNELRSLTYYYRRNNIQGDNRKHIIFQGHKEIFYHIKNGDDVNAGLAMENHIAQDLKHLKTLFNE